LLHPKLAGPIFFFFFFFSWDGGWGNGWWDAVGVFSFVFSRRRQCIAMNMLLVRGPPFFFTVRVVQVHLTRTREPMRLCECGNNPLERACIHKQIRPCKNILKWYWTQAFTNILMEL
jgi:hypothetical protein